MTKTKQHRISVEFKNQSERDEIKDAVKKNQQICE